MKFMSVIVFVVVVTAALFLKLLHYHLLVQQWFDWERFGK